MAAVLPTLLEGLGWIADNGETIVSVLAGIGAGFVAFKVASVINAVVAALTSFKAAATAGAAVQWLVNAAMAANPIMLVVTLVATLVAAIVGFIATNEDARAALVNVWEAIKTAIGTAVEKIVTFLQRQYQTHLTKLLTLLKVTGKGFCCFL